MEKKEKPGPIKADVNADRTKQMLPGFFDSYGLPGTYLYPFNSQGCKIIAIHIVTVLDTFMKNLRKKKPLMLSQKCFFHWDNASVYTAAIVQA